MNKILTEFPVHLPALRSSIRAKIREIWPFSKKRLYQTVSIFNILLIATVMYFGYQPAKRLISPLISQYQPIVHLKGNYSSFAFMPGWSVNKFDDIRLSNIETLAFFDIPVDADGTLVLDSKGYRVLQLDESQAVFENAHINGKKVLLTVTMSNTQKIKALLASEEAKKTFIEQVVFEVKLANLDGAVIDFETLSEMSSTQRSEFDNLVGRVKEEMHSKIPGSQVAVAVPSSVDPSKGLYDSHKLANSADKLFVLAYNFATPEFINSSQTSPKYGNQESEYWQEVGKSVGALINNIPHQRVSIEASWYGNGADYPLYTPKDPDPVELASKDPTSVNLDSETLESLVKGVPAKSRESARRNIPIIAQALKDEGILDSNVLAYALATIEHETAEEFEPIDEYSGRLSARRLGYEGGGNYYGRGFIQLTHLRNYKVMGERIGMGDALAKDPSLASKPEVAAKILAAFFKDNNIANLASKGMFVAARRPVNPDVNGYKVAMLAGKYGI